MTIRDRRWGLYLLNETLLRQQTSAFEAAIEALRPRGGDEKAETDDHQDGR